MDLLKRKHSDKYWRIHPNEMSKLKETCLATGSYQIIFSLKKYTKLCKNYVLPNFYG